MMQKIPVGTIVALAFVLIAVIILDAPPSTLRSVTYAQVADTPTPTPTPEVEQSDDAPKTGLKESDSEDYLDAQPVVDEPRPDSTPSLGNAQSIVNPLTSHLDYDADNDGLIEISTLEQLNAIRWDLNGSGASDRASDAGNYSSAFPSAVAGMGCPSSGCRGYELTRSLDFDDATSYASRSVNTSWTQGEGWLPIGFYSSLSSGVVLFDAVFDGNTHTISNLYIDRSSIAGLIATSSGYIRRIGLTGVDVSGSQIGALVGFNYGLIAQAYATGRVTGRRTNTGGLVGWSGGVIAYSYADVDVVGVDEVGGLVGDTHTIVVSSYSMGSVSGTTEVGGLTGDNEGGGIIYSYASGSVVGNSRVGSFAGDNRNSLIRSSYWDTQTSGQSAGVGVGPSIGIDGKTSSELRAPTWYYGIYADWHHAGDVWDFGTSADYPSLKPDLDLNLDLCDQSISAIGRVGIIGVWADDCISTNRSGRYARFYTFTLDTESEVTINLLSIYDGFDVSDIDTYLYLLEGAGRGGRIIEQDDDDGYSSNSRITRRLPRGTYTIEATTLNAGSAGYFGLIIDGVPIADPPPAFTLGWIASKSSVEAGESFDLTVQMHSVHGASGEHGGISVSFPQLTDDYDGTDSYSSEFADVELVSYTTGTSNVTFYEHGDLIARRVGGRTAADYLLVESDDPTWSEGDTRTLVLRITPKQNEDIQILIRGWICADEYMHCSRKPTSFVRTDPQQGWPVGELKVGVFTPPPTFTLDWSASKTSVEVEESFDLTVRMHNVQGSPGEHGGISVSFPQLTDDYASRDSYSSDLADVELVSYTTGTSNVTFLEFGDAIHRSVDNALIAADYLLVESDDPSWSEGDDRTLVLRITPKQNEDLQILIRGWICANEYMHCSRQPSDVAAKTDPQQGWPVEEIAIDVFTLRSASEQIVFYSTRDGDAEIYVMSVDGSDVRQLTDNSKGDWGPDLSPDEEQIAFYSEDEDGDLEIYVMSVDGSDVRQLTDNSRGDRSPDWSPDGEQIAFTSEDEDGDLEIYVLNVENPSDVRQLTDNSKGDWDPDWSPDGERIAFYSVDEDGDLEIYALDVETPSNVTQLTHNDSVDAVPHWSPDGEQIAFYSTRDGDAEIYVLDVENPSDVRQLTDNFKGDWDPVWSPDGERLALVSNRDGDAEIYVLDVENPSNVTQLTYDDAGDWAPHWSRGCVRFLGELKSPRLQRSTWIEECESMNKSGSYARFYIFSLSEETRMKINVSSTGVDPYLFLLNGKGKDGEVIAENGDRVDNDRRDSHLFITLSAGDYTVEATTNDSNVEGEFEFYIQAVKYPDRCRELLPSSDDARGNLRKCVNGSDGVTFSEQKRA